MNQCATGIFVFVSANPRRQPNRCPNKHHDKRRQTTTTKSNSTKSDGPFAVRLVVVCLFLVSFLFFSSRCFERPGLVLSVLCCSYCGFPGFLSYRFVELLLACFLLERDMRAGGETLPPGSPFLPALQSFSLVHERPRAGTCHMN